MSDRLAAARAEITRLEARWQRHQPSKHSRYLLAVLAAARGTLDRHRTRYSVLGVCVCCAQDWPCPDAAAVLAIYAPEASDE